MPRFGVLLILVVALPATGEELKPSGRLEFLGAVSGADDLSAIAKIGRQLAIVSDETAEVTLLQAGEPASDFRVAGHLPLGDDPDAELDLEALAANGSTLYVLGSHSAVRKQVDAEASRKENRKRLNSLSRSFTRDVLVRVRFDGEDETAEPRVESISLRNLIVNDPILSSFVGIPSKENGIDLEGLAVDDKTLFVGCRGPVLRGNWVPVVVTTFKEPQDYELRFVNLGGLGIRDLAHVSDGLLVLAGPVGDGPGGFELYHWDGEDCLPDAGETVGRIRQLGTIPAPTGGNAEGIAVLDETTNGWRLVVIFDGIEGGAPTLFEVKK
jgi:hypothetical protein